MKSCAETTQTAALCLKAISLDLFTDMVKAFKEMNFTHGDREFFSTIPKEVFSLPALLINVLTDSHFDGSDWKNGLAIITPFGEFIDGLFCVRLLKRKIALQPGGVLAVVGEKLEHFCTPWRGRRRYSMVHTAHENTRTPSAQLNHARTTPRVGPQVFDGPR